MARPLNVVAVNGSAQQPSRTLALVQALLDELAGRLLLQTRIVNLGDIARPLGAALSRAELPAEIESEIAAIESADLLVVAAPVYRGSYPGHFKHLFDLVGQDALIDKPVLLAATGGSDRHALVLEHQLRPLFGFLQALTLPIGVYGSPGTSRTTRSAARRWRSASGWQRTARRRCSARAGYRCSALRDHKRPQAIARSTRFLSGSAIPLG